MFTFKVRYYLLILFENCFYYLKINEKDRDRKEVVVVTRKAKSHVYKHSHRHMFFLFCFREKGRIRLIKTNVIKKKR